VPIPGQVTAKKDGDAISFVSSAPGRDGARLQGLARALLASAVKGSAEGYEKVLELVGTGYRAEVKGKVITLALGFSHPTNVPVPPSITAVVPPDSKGTPARAHFGGQSAARAARRQHPRSPSARTVRRQRHSLPRREQSVARPAGRQGQGQVTHGQANGSGAPQSIRIRSKISGTSERPRLSVFRTGRHIYAQVVVDDDGKTLAAASTLSGDLKNTLGEDNKDRFPRRRSAR